MPNRTHWPMNAENCPPGGLAAELVAEQMRHTLDLLRMEIAALRAQVEQGEKLSAQRLAALEKSRDDLEARMRAVSDGVSQFKVASGLASGGSSLLALAALLRSLLGM